MGAVAYLLLVVLAVLVSAQLLILMDRGIPLRKRLRDLGTGGDAASLLVVVLLMGSSRSWPAILLVGWGPGGSGCGRCRGV